MSKELEHQYQEFREAFYRIQDEISKRIVGQEKIVEGALICLMTGGHALLEGVPGLGKTLLIRTLHEVLDLGCARIQFTPDLMPADIIGTNIVAEDEDGRKFFSGPVFSNLVLADEINRATPKTQSALLEAMQEKSVAVAGKHHTLQPLLRHGNAKPTGNGGHISTPCSPTRSLLFQAQGRISEPR